jgi:hypothetical protein
MSLPQVRLVDIHGREITPDDQGNAATWPVSNDVDGWEWVISDAEIRALLAEVLDRDAPPLSQVSPDELAMMSGGLAVG